MRRWMVAALACALTGCGSAQVRTWTEEESPPPEIRRRVGVEPAVAGTEFLASVHRIDLEVEGVYDVEGVRRTTERRAVRDFDPWLEVGEMSAGLFLSPAIVASFPFFFGIAGPLMLFEDRSFDLVLDYLAFVPEKALDPTENDLFGEERIEVVSTREDRWTGQRSGPLSPEEASSIRLTVQRIVAVLTEGEAAEVGPEGYRQDGWSIVLPDPIPGVVAYRVDLLVDGRPRSLQVAVR